MKAPLELRVTRFQNDGSWDWRLSDGQGRFLADCEARLAAEPRRLEALRDLPAYLDRRRGAFAVEHDLAELGEWLGKAAFGPVAAELARRRRGPATVVRVVLPPEALPLVSFPLELAYLGEPRKPLALAGVRLVYELDDGGPPAAGETRPVEGALRVLAVFSLPHGENPLNLRRERRELETLVERLAQAQGLGVELRVLQYGATRETLEDELREGDGWDLIHLSGHGLEGEFALEDAQGEPAAIAARELANLLRLASDRLKLLTLSSCLSGALGVAAARRRIGLEALASTDAARDPEAVVAATRLPALGQRLAAALDCAVVAMRYSVGDAFARETALGLYGLLFGKGQTLPAALQLAVGDAVGDGGSSAAPPLSPFTPVLFGRRAAALSLRPPPRGPVSFAAPRAGRQDFPGQPAHFVGRLKPMLRAHRALAPESDLRGVLLHGMAGGGKSACALELAYRHERGRFAGWAWWKAPDEEARGTCVAGAAVGRADIAGALTSCALALETQLPGLKLVGLLDGPEEDAVRARYGLRGLLARESVLIVLDNLESLLDTDNRWRDPRWGELVETLLGHRGLSRVVFTSRRVPADLENHPALHAEAIHALRFPESVLLARDLPGLAGLFATPEGRSTLQRALAMAQGHPKLLELAAGLASEGPEALARQLDREEARATGAAGEERRGFLQEEETRRGPEEFVAVLEAWTDQAVAALPQGARRLFEVLSCLEEEDRDSEVLAASWRRILTRLGEEGTAAPGGATRSYLAPALDRLTAAGLVESEQVSAPAPPPSPGAPAGSPPKPAPEGVPAALRRFRLHPVVAAQGRRDAREGVTAAVDRELGAYWLAIADGALKREMEGAGGVVVLAGLRGASYLLRAARWNDAARLLEQALSRDPLPSTVARVLPALTALAEVSAGTTAELNHKGTLAKALRSGGRLREAESLTREVVAEAERRDDSQTAWVAAGQLVGLLTTTGRLPEALDATERLWQLSLRAGLGPWSRLSNQVQRLQVLHRLGRYSYVLAEVERLRAEMERLPVETDPKDPSRPLNVQEGLFDVGWMAAVRLGRWQDALRLNSECVAVTVSRGASEVEVARARFRDIGPLIELRRLPEAQALLGFCRRVFESSCDLPMLGKTLGTLAALANEEGSPSEAVAFGQLALRYLYLAGVPEDCANIHNNFAIFAHNAGSSREEVVSHHLAAAVISFQTGSGTLATILDNLALSAFPETPPSFEEVAARVEEVEGVHFRALFDALPRRAPDGDSAIAAVWEQVAEERARLQHERTKLEAVRERLSRFSTELAEAFEARDAGRTEAALAALPPERREEALALLAEGGWQGPDLNEVVRRFEPLLQDLARVARCDEEPRPQAEAALAEMEKNGWHLTGAVHRIWAGERDGDALTAGLDEQDSALVRHLLELLAAPAEEPAR